MTDPVIWPRQLLIPKRAPINQAPATVSGPVALSGARQAVSSLAGVWSITYDQVVISSVNQRLTYRALQAQVEGRMTPIILPVFDRDELRAIIDGERAEGITYSDGSLHSDGSGYTQSRAHVVLNAAVARGDTQMTTDTIAGSTIQPGQYFSIGTRLYIVKSITSVVGSKTTFKFWPRARENHPDVAYCEFDEPVCKVRLVDDNGLNLELESGLYGFPTIDFIEDPN